MTEPNEMLWEGVIEKNLDKVRIALNFRADVNAKDGDGWIPLHEAAERNSLELAQLLISSGADLEAEDNGDKTPLHWARSQEMKTLLQGVTI